MAGLAKMAALASGVMVLLMKRDRRDAVIQDQYCA